MKSHVIGLRVAGTLFGLMSIAQLVRSLLGMEIVVAGHQLPVWPSGVAFVVLATLSGWLWKLSMEQKS